MKDETEQQRERGNEQERTPDADDQKVYAMQVVNLVNIARRIRGGEAEAVADEIVGVMEVYLATMASFDDTPLTIATFYAAGKLMREAGKELSPAVAAKVEKFTKLQKRVLSEDCYKLKSVCTGTRCVAWPTSLRPVDVETTDEVGWRYIKDSHCGFKWNRPWKECGEPLGLFQCQP